MNRQISNQMISGGFIFTIGLAMFTLLNNHYQQPLFFGLIYVVAMITQFVLMKKFGEQRSKKNKMYVTFSFIFLGISCYFSIYLGINVLNDLAKTWILLLFFVGLHFLFFIPANQCKHWKIQVVMVILLVLNTVMGFFFYPAALGPLFIVDGMVKIVSGASLFYYSARELSRWLVSAFIFGERWKFV